MKRNSSICPSGLALAGLLALVGTVFAADTEKPQAPGSKDRITVARLAVEQEKIAPKEVAEIAPGHYFIDFGKAAFAGLELDVTSDKPNQSLVVHLGESLSAPRTVHRTPGGSVRYLTATIPLKEGRQTVKVPLTAKDARLMMSDVGAVMPFRYVEVESAPSRLTAGDVRQLAAHYPFDEQAGQFSCSDPKLNAIWEMCKHTMKATSFGGVFVDGDRERKPYEADAYINQLGWYYCAGDSTLPRYSHEYLILHPTWPTEWIMFSVLMAWEDYRFTGDTRSLKEFYEDLKAKTLLALARPDGLISTVEPPFPKEVGDAIHIKAIRDIVDWPGVERDGCEMKPVNTVVNAFHCLALQRMAALSDALGKPEDAALFRTAYGRALQSFNEKLADPATGLYLDGEGSKHSSLHANMFPLAFGLVPKDRVANVTAFVKSRGMACSVYGAQFLMDALFDNGEATCALGLMTADGNRSWTHMIERVGTTIALEAWDTKFKPNQDWNHAWGAAPADVLPRNVLGVEPLEPGYSKILIQPHPGNLAWAEGRVPTPLGPVAIRFEKKGNAFSLKAGVPPKTTAVVCVPTSDKQSVTESGKPVEQSKGIKFLRMQNGAASYEVGPGSFQFGSVLN